MNIFKKARLNWWPLSVCVLVASFAYSQSVLASGGQPHAHSHGQTQPEKTSEAMHEHTENDHSHDGHSHESLNQPTANKSFADSHEQPDEDTEHSNEVSLSPEQMALANIIVTPVKSAVFEQSVYAPGEVKANGYKSYVVSPRIESVVVRRHAILGQHVQVGDPLVTLFSETMAQAQANYRVAYNDWQRAKRLAQGTVSESQLLSDETQYVAALSKLKAFGLTQQAIANIVKDNSSGLGEYTLVAQRAGAVLQDEFSQGQRVSAGQEIMVLADESQLWVEAKVSANRTLEIPVGAIADVSIGDEIYQGRVIQEAHTIDLVTRTRTIRLAVDNTLDKLHPGMFVDVYFAISSQRPIVALPEQAMMRNPDGDWVVFVEDETNTFKAVEISRGRRFGDLIEVDGVEPGKHIVMQGAFFVASELAKGGFDPHNH